jgi:hypothetical protein
MVLSHDHRTAARYFTQISDAFRCTTSTKREHVFFQSQCGLRLEESLSLFVTGLNR